LGFTDPIAIPESLRRTIEWERANPPSDVAVATFDYAAEDAALKGTRDRRLESGRSE
jgi:hypothetical protein